MRSSAGVGSLACYDQLDQVGEGTYGYVFKARDKRSNTSVALKRLIIHREAVGFPLCAVREIKFLKSLQHKNIVQLRDICTSKGSEHLEVSVQKLSDQGAKPVEAAAALDALAPPNEGDKDKAKDSKQQAKASIKKDQVAQNQMAMQV